VGRVVGERKQRSEVTESREQPHRTPAPNDVAQAGGAAPYFIDALVEGRSDAAAASDSWPTERPAAQRGAVAAGLSDRRRATSSGRYDRPFASL
jgi:hypothetical protein